MNKNKFKAQRITNPNEWVYGYLIKDPQQNTYISTGQPKDDTFEVYEVDHKTVKQFVGVTDKNGIDIYENDLVAWKNLYCRIIYSYEYAAYVLMPVYNDCNFELGICNTKPLSRHSDDYNPILLISDVLKQITIIDSIS